MESDFGDEEMMKKIGDSRVCSDCQTSKTPLWRSGPDGPKSLCNACGIRFRKRRKSNAVSQREEKRKQRINNSERKVGVSVQVRIFDNEDEEAAILLMALSCGLVYA